MRYALVYGPIAGAIAITVIVATLALDLPNHSHSLWFGYLVMLAALSLIFVAVKRYRDVEKGGVIHFLPALGLGLCIAVVAAITYAALFEAYLAATGYTFFDDYVASLGQGARASGAAPAEVARQVAEMESYRPLFENPLVRPLMIFSELFPVGLLVALVSAALLRNPRFLPSRG